jgi:hypothetical protein
VVGEAVQADSQGRVAFRGELRVPVRAALLERRDHAVLDPARLSFALAWIAAERTLKGTVSCAIRRA